MWIPPEIKDPILFHAPTRKSVGYFGAVRLRDGKFLFRRESGRFNAETFFQFLLVFRQPKFVTTLAVPVFWSRAMGLSSAGSIVHSKNSNVVQTYRLESEWAS
jgi:hypothetical protein